MMEKEGREKTSQDITRNIEAVLPRTLDNPLEKKELRDYQDPTEAPPDDWSDDQKTGYNSVKLQ